MSDETVWAAVATVGTDLMEDQPALDAYLTHLGDEQLAQAHAAGVTINGDPQVTTVPLVWVDDWSDEGGALVTVEAARMVGITDEPTAVAVRMEWDR